MMDFTRYEFTLDCDHPDWLTDVRHVKIIYEFLMANNFTRVAEIGSYSGVSTAAFIEALNQGKDFKFHIAEPAPTRQLRTLISMCKKPDNILLHVQKGEDVLEYWRDFDFVFIDGNHNIEAAGAELLMVLRNDIENIMAHDTNIYKIAERHHPCKGSELIGRVFKSHEEYHYIEDKESRKGEKTDRGFILATKNKERYEIGKKIFEELC
tara:strand:- start:2892 stop:3518 length:627 start_codon:yes stop_codon:yes gene_type:complete